MITRWICEKDNKKWLYPVEKCIYCKGPITKQKGTKIKVIGITQVNIPSPMHPLIPYNIMLLERPSSWWRSSRCVVRAAARAPASGTSTGGTMYPERHVSFLAPPGGGVSAHRPGSGICPTRSAPVPTISRGRRGQRGPCDDRDGGAAAGALTLYFGVCRQRFARVPHTFGHPAWHHRAAPG